MCERLLLREAARRVEWHEALAQPDSEAEQEQLHNQYDPPLVVRCFSEISTPEVTPEVIFSGWSLCDRQGKAISVISFSDSPL